MNMKALTTALLWLVAIVASANDGVFYVNGAHLIPLQETDVAVTKEVLTITLDDSEYAKVDVQYEFTNRGGAKTVNVGFEAEAPYNDFDVPFDPSGRHPYIKDFTVEMNGSRLTYQTAVVESGSAEEPSNFVPLDMKVWRTPTNQDEEYWGNNLINRKTGESKGYACAYYFKAAFQPGKNTVHHTYRYRMSNGVGRAFEVPYWLTPALRWANGQIDDFTLRIKVPTTAKYFSLDSELFQGAQFTVTQGKGKVRATKTSYGTSHTEIALRKGTVEWHKRAFRPKDNLNIYSADTFLDWETAPLGAFYDRGEHYVPSWRHIDQAFTQDERRILRNLPYASRGYVFKDAKLKAYFAKLWWYMPDPSWQQDTSDFTKAEWRLINENK